MVENNGVDGQIGQRIDQPGHFKKQSGRNGRGMAFRCGTKQGAIQFHRRLALRLPLQPEGQAHFHEEQTGRDKKYAFQAQLFHQDAAGEIGERSSHGPDDIINADQTLQSNGRFAFAHQRFQGRPGQAQGDVPRHQVLRWWPAILRPGCQSELPPPSSPCPNGLR